jgi:heptaprenyl diphosphate synthase
MVLLALFTSISLTIFMVEALLPPPAPIVGVKLGLANVVTLFMLVAGGGRSALEVLFARLVLAAIFVGQVMSFVFSLCGGLLAFAAMLAASRLAARLPVWFVSVCGGIFHNIGQMIAAVIFLGPAVLAYLPYLVIAGCIAGAVTGILTDMVMKKMDQAGALAVLRPVLEGRP